MTNSTQLGDRWEEFPPEKRFLRLSMAAYLESKKKNHEALNKKDHTIISRAAKVAEMFDFQHNEYHGHFCHLCAEREFLNGFSNLFRFFESKDMLSDEKGVSLGNFQLMVMDYCGWADNKELPIRFSQFCKLSVLQKYIKKVEKENLFTI